MGDDGGAGLEMLKKDGREQKIIGSRSKLVEKQVSSLLMKFRSLAIED